ncbi:hypothetical protein ACQEU8_36385 [Streptomyces sp. CA-250714]|uniref:hypothetical protein n=1 Tax=Streptomyces sp. CA-250714 TaxID=3240060 RepID=UPI003D9278C6
MTNATTGQRMEPDELAQALKETAAGWPSKEAAVTLLLEHDYWVARIAYSHPDLRRTDPETGCVVDLDWQALAAGVTDGRLTSSTSQQAVLSVALSLVVPGFLLDLQRAVSSLGAFHVAAVLRAIATAGGYPELGPKDPENDPDDIGPGGQESSLFELDYEPPSWYPRAGGRDA